MIRKSTLIIIIILCNSIPSTAKIKTDVSLGAYVGIAPLLGGNLNSRVQESVLEVSGGIDGINRKASGIKSHKIDKLLGMYGGINVKGIIIDYLLVRFGVNFTMNLAGGDGTTVDASLNKLKAEYSMWVIDAPLSAGVSIPIGKTVRISLSGGIAFAYGNYKNSFKSTAVNSKAEFAGWTFPWVIMLEGEYFVKPFMALMTTFSYYHGSTDVIKSNSDYARIDFSGFRWCFGLSFYFKKKQKQI